MSKDKKSILFDLIAMEPNVTGSKFHGAAECAKNILWSLSKLENDVSIDCFYIKDFMPDICDNIIGMKKGINYIKIQNIKEIEKILSSKKYYTFYSALPYDYFELRIPKETKFVYTIHGLRNYEKLFDRYMIYYQKNRISSYINYLWKAMNQEKLIKNYLKKIEKLINITDNRYIITDSDHSKYSILLTCKSLNKNEIHVLYPPTGLVREITDDKKSFNFLKKWKVEENKYFLMISCNRWIKNSYRVVKAFDKMFSERPEILNNYKVVLLGITDECRYITKVDNKDKFVFEGYVEDKELNEIYKMAYAFVYPTLNEGYGYPPIESMRYGTVPLCASNSSIIEICKEAACYFNPYDIKEIMNRIYQIMNKEKYDDYAEKGKNHYISVKEAQEKDLEKICHIILEHKQ